MCIETRTKNPIDTRAVRGKKIEREERERKRGERTPLREVKPAN